MNALKTAVFFIGMCFTSTLFANNVREQRGCILTIDPQYSKEIEVVRIIRPDGRVLPAFVVKQHEDKWEVELKKDCYSNWVGAVVRPKDPFNN